MTTVIVYTYKESGKWYDMVEYQTPLKPHEKGFYEEANSKIQPEMRRVIFEKCEDGHLQPLWMTNPK